MNSVESLLPPASSPYYIVTPPYVRTSAGIRTLHVLARALRTRGHEAYLVCNSKIGEIPASHPALGTPFLEHKIANLHFVEGRTPIVIYPETIHGNPLSAPYVVRYILNHIGHLGGPQSYHNADHLIYYADDLRRGADGLCLFVPVSDPRIFKPPPEGTKRKGVVVYGSKYRNYHKGDYFGLTSDFIEITRDQPNSQSIKEIVHILQTSDVLYCYENSAITIEAILCGCPVVLLKNEHFKTMIAEKELTTNGIAFSPDPDSIGRARATVSKFRENYLGLFDNFWLQLDQFIEESQARAAAIEYKTKIAHEKYPISSLPLRKKIKVALRSLILFFQKNGTLKTTGLLLKMLKGRYGRHEIRMVLSREYYYYVTKLP